MKTCGKCKGLMMPNRVVDFEAGVTVMEWSCLNCGARKFDDRAPVPIVKGRRSLTIVPGEQ